ncbi:MAG: DUF4450 domain-containing protein [Anaerolineae bacterium]
MAIQASESQEQFPRQEWMIWANDPWQWYEATTEGFRIVNGRFHYNRVLHGPPGAMKVLAGDRPQVKLAETPHWHYGDLSFAVQRGSVTKWCHDFARIEAIYDPGMMVWALSDPALGKLELRIQVVPLADAPGAIVRIDASEPTRLLWCLTGLMRKDGSILAQGPLPGGLDAGMAQGCHLRLREWWIEGAHPQCPKLTVAAAKPRGVFRFTDSLHLPELSQPIDIEVKDTRMPYCLLELDQEPAYIVLIAMHEQGPVVLARLLEQPEQTFQAAVARQKAVQSQGVVETPNLLLDQAVKGICSSLDGCWLPPSYLHGAVRWGIETKGWFLGWRGWYGPTCLGWYDRVASAIRFHGQQRVREGTEGYMSRGKLQDWVGFDGSYGGWVEGNMGEVYLDHLYYYYCWTGDKELLREMWPVIKEAVEWERRVLDTDNDHLFENHINTWISDGHWYCGGPGAQASAYMYRAYHLAAEAASLVGENPQPFLELARATREAMNERLWLREEGHYAEYQESLEPRRLHAAAELPTIYHPIDSSVTDMFQAYQALRYVETRLWFDNNVLLVNDWYPVIVTNGTIAFSEMLHVALSYYQLGQREQGWRLLQACLTPFVKARVPGTISAYGGWDARQGTYPEFTDTCSMFARTVVEGLFGIRPQRQDNLLIIQPNLPEQWPSASIQLPDVRYSFERAGTNEKLTIETREASRKRVLLPARYDRVDKVLLNGQGCTWRCEAGMGQELIVVETEAMNSLTLEVRYEGGKHRLNYPTVVASSGQLSLTAHGCTIEEVFDPQHLLIERQLTPSELRASIGDSRGQHTFFVKLRHGNTESWAPVDLDIRQALAVTQARWLTEGFEKGIVRYELTLRNNTATPMSLLVQATMLGQGSEAQVMLPAYAQVALQLPLTDWSALAPGSTPLHIAVSGDYEGSFVTSLRLWRPYEKLPALPTTLNSFRPIALPYNDRLEDLFTRDYYDPKLPESALRIARDGLNAWTGTWYKPDYITMEHVREHLDKHGLFVSDVGVPFRQAHEGANGVFISRWPGWPTSATIPVRQRGRKLYLLLAGTTNNNQFEVANGAIALLYADGREERIELVNPSNYDHMLQHFSLKGYPQWIGGARDGYYGVGHASGTHADILDIDLLDGELVKVRLECISNEVIIGLLGLTVL